MEEKDAEAAETKEEEEGERGDGPAAAGATAKEADPPAGAGECQPDEGSNHG
eukprot:NODE_4671_length_339_cov_168.817241_g4064_i0.p4 GENE.NODE_4671_length_339_cov_168.817241_g4064_i0~~NODE_4671_length_339_cov_168.817241_g4064_i0.p4  ORF type:complete len:60 (+),score=33.22 NODE_4671_length_339_cov_168.817241_g4064_i0:27-182(+)